MNKKTTEAIKEIEERIARLRKVSKAIEELPALDVNLLYESCDSICMSIPYDLKRIRETRSALGSEWKVARPPRIMDSGSWVVDYIKANDSNISLTLFADPYGPGATCHKVQCGTKQIPIYKIVCDRHANTR